ncbi:hypothetical protein CH379_012880 [Leptospira ellisii]|uniref:Uncharacterized protein n=1 Tax=Leptospira ellisii TaxID=2023197 RepID=A0A2N0BDB8_9LEPT|nr:hypothetical protein [Leptospira ellisii]MDV6236522.1 hypothetical protein [Leptospira ellisii]PJZ94559.1 hypothetical protein CH379_02075 [Leptospira ellisii]PKA04703.1 hypothetical protein CH375_09390 [Leptospira ellisii]
MSLNKRKLILILLVVSSFTFGVRCSEKRPFVRLENPANAMGRLYVIRPIETALAAWTYEFELRKYKRHFKESSETVSVSVFRLSNGEFYTENLEEGFYRLTIPSKPDVDKILRIEKGKTSFYRFIIFNEKEISMPDFFIKEIIKEDALSDLLENEHLNEVSKR